MDNSEPNKSAYRWQLPSESPDRAQLKILNSYTRKKELFVPNKEKLVRWYSCGPTVYDVSHLGHARCYITFDIIRRILSAYFGYQVFYVMNITDIDDKIIKRARSNYLCNQFIEKCLGGQFNFDDLIIELSKAIHNYKERKDGEKDPDKVNLISSVLRNSMNSLNKLKDLKSLEDKEQLTNLLEELRDVISDEQDATLAHTVMDHHIFKELAMKFEQEFHEDMRKLDVLPPSALSRVSEYIEETGLYLKRLEANGFAYRTSDGSVYFDTNKFDSDPRHCYAKLMREAYGQKKNLDEGEGELSQATQETRKSPNDFALWKKSKVGEPSWKTQDYEPGRPGWHIECSVMASDLLGNSFDIHSGGCDLKFPHHDNEIAQAEAYFGTGVDWVNYFIHSGHLTISGCKMSKSLKNFITIRQALQEYSSRQLRFAFLAHGWAQTLDYSPNTMKTATSYEKTFKEFFLNVLDNLRHRLCKSTESSGDNKMKLCDLYSKWTKNDLELNALFMQTVAGVDKALCDNLDTRTSLDVLINLVKECNKRPHANPILLKDISSFVFKILGIFGANFPEFNLESLPVFSKSSQDAAVAGKSPSEDVLKYVETLAQFRADVRNFSKTDKEQCWKKMLSLCDTLRDDILPNMGVRLEDKEVDGKSFVVKLVDPTELAKERMLLEKRKEEKKMDKNVANLKKLTTKKK